MNKKLSKRKRAIDLVGAICVLSLLSPFLCLTALFVRLFLGKPIIFRQQRPGWKEKPFVLYKFRTMSNKVDGTGELLPDEQRLTFFGRLLRSTSIDELPELFNVIKGDMSLVGPRPLLMEYLPHYSDHQRRRHEVRPGITGWSQINGRNNLGWQQRFDLDVWYIDNWSLRLDCKILLLTIIKVVKREGISAQNGAAMNKFTGNSDNLPQNGNGS